MNLFCCIPNVDDATSFYRALQPVSHLRKIMPDFNLYFSGNNIGSSDLSHMDVAFLQRPSGKQHLDLIHLCKNLGVKVWIDYDDDLLNVPRANPAHSLYGTTKSKDTIREILNLADVISVSTRHLAKAISKELKTSITIKVIPNAFNDYLFRNKPVFRPHNLVFWRGTQSHQQDLMNFSPEIIKASHAQPQWLFNFMGYEPFYMIEALQNQCIFTPGVDIFSYHKIIQDIYPNISIVTLSDTDFNRCKSNIAWIEATYAGAVTLAPDFEEWQKPGMVTYKGPEDFGVHLQDLLRVGSHQNFSKYHALSWEYIMDNLRLSHVNRLRATMLEELL